MIASALAHAHALLMLRYLACFSLAQALTPGKKGPKNHSPLGPFGGAIRERSMGVSHSVPRRKRLGQRKRTKIAQHQSSRFGLGYVIRPSNGPTPMAAGIRHRIRSVFPAIRVAFPRR